MLTGEVSFSVKITELVIMVLMMRSKMSITWMISSASDNNWKKEEDKEYSFAMFGTKKLIPVFV